MGGKDVQFRCIFLVAFGQSALHIPAIDLPLSLESPTCKFEWLVNRIQSKHHSYLRSGKTHSELQEESGHNRGALRVVCRKCFKINVGFRWRRTNSQWGNSGRSGLYRLRKNSTKGLCNKGTALAGPIRPAE